MVANALPPSPTDEEVAGPAPSFNPTQRAERISSVDILRGFALLGILVVNIEDFGTTEAAHDIPIGTPIDSFNGPHAHLNLAVLLFKWLFIEGKMRGIFAMLFGAGVILLTSRAERRGAAAGVADIYTRRNMLLVVFGFLHGAFIFAGDILFDYGLNALLFLYPARKLKTKTLILTGLLLSLVLGTVCITAYLGGLSDFRISREASATALRQQQHQPVSVAELAVEKQWQLRVNSKRITPASVHASLVEAHSGYWEHVKGNINGRLGPRFALHFLTETCDAVAAMLIGMGLFRTGFLDAKSSNATYAWTAIAGFAVSVPLTTYGILHSYADSFYFLTVEKWLIVPYQLTRDAGMLAIAACVLLLIKHGMFRTPQRWLAAVGRTAFSNYILTSLICQWLFLWGPFKLFGKLEYYQLMYVVFGVWTVNLVVSSYWLRHYEYGPLEWLWRSLTYSKAQPMRLRSAR